MGELLVDIAWGYAAVGAAVAAVFLTVGIGRVSPDARGAYAFRPLLVPGVILLWPAVVWRWVALERGAAWGAAQHRPPRVAQEAAALALMVIVPALVFGTLLIRQGPGADAPVRLDAPESAAAQASP